MIAEIVVARLSSNGASRRTTQTATVQSDSLGAMRAFSPSWLTLVAAGITCACSFERPPRVGDDDAGSDDAAIGDDAAEDGGDRAPSVASTTPADLGSDVEPVVVIVATFSEAMDPATINATSFVVTRGAVSVPGQVTYDPANHVATFQPEARLSLLGGYTATITTAVTDLGGTPMLADHAWSFTVRDGVWGTPQLIETDNAGDATTPQIAVDGSGNAVAVWSQSDGTRQNIWANRFVPGTGWGIAQLIEIDNVGNAVDPQLAIDAMGNAIAVWSQSDGTRDNIMANRFVPGTGWGASQIIETDNAGPAIIPQVAVDAAGNAVAVWSQWDSSRYNVWANRFVPGTGWGTPQLVETNNAGGVFTPGVAVDAAGNAVAIWSQADATRNNIWANRFVPGFGWGTAQVIEVDNNTACCPQVAVDAAGNGVAIWSQSGDLWSSRFIPGTGWGAAQPIGSDVPWESQVASNPMGNAIAIWSQFDTTYNIWANQFTPGSGWGTADLIETDNAGPAVSPQVALDTMGNGVAIWSQSDGTQNNVVANRFVSGTGWGTAQLIETGGGAATIPQIVVDPAGAAFGVWVQSDGTRTNIWASSFR